ncbi:MAG: hypothetical protein LC122_11860 [Chitinophagales bacterium]|nr:hypothetical protein [Chitinophagales bacterium]
MSNVKEFIVTNQDGTVDIEKSQLKFNEALDAYISDKTASNGGFLALFDEFFNSNIGKYVQKNSLIDALAIKYCNNDLNKFQEIKSKMSSWVKDNTGKTREDGKIFAFKAGAKGGIARWADIE